MMMQMEHEEAQALFSAHMDGELDPEPAAKLAEHLAGCAACREDLERLTSALDGLRKMPTPPPATDLLAGVQSKIRKRSRGRYFRRGFSVGGPRIPYEIIGLLMLLLLLVVYLGMATFQDIGPAR